MSRSLWSPHELEKVRRINRWTWRFVGVLFLPGTTGAVFGLPQIGFFLIALSMFTLGVGTFAGMMATSVGRSAF